MRWVKWVLAGIAGIIAYKVYNRVQAFRASKNKGAIDTTENRAPGFVGNLLDDVKGAFNFGPNPSVPAIASAYGFVGSQPPTGSEGYVATNSDHRIPSFLQGATGGVQDPAMQGDAPPPVLGPPPTAGSGAYFAPRSGIATENYRAAGGRKGGLTNTNPVLKQKTTGKAAPVAGGGFVSPKATNPKFLQ